MEVLPLRFLDHDDISIVGRELVDLAALKRLGFPVPDGIVLLPPHIPFTTVLKAIKERDKDRFEQSLDIFRKQIFAIPVPVELGEHLKGYPVSVETVWKDALTVWLDQIRSRVWRLGVSDQLVEGLPAQPILFTGRQISFGSAYFNTENQKIVISVGKGELADTKQRTIEQMVEKIKRTFLINYVFDWVVDQESVWLVRIYPFTHAIEDTAVDEKIEIQKFEKQVSEAKKIRTTLKIFADLSDGLTIAKDVDGIFINSEKIESEDQKILKLVESALIVDEDVIFQLADIRDQSDVSSTLRLINQPQLLEKELQAYLFAKHHYSKAQNETLQKRILQNLFVGIPAVRSVLELKKLQQLLKQLGVESKGLEKVWLDFSVPENWIHLDDYLDNSIKGIVINLDELFGFLIGNERYLTDPYYDFSPKVVLAFIQPYMKQIHQKKIPVLLRSEHVLDSEIIQFAITSGVYGLILRPYHLAGAAEYVSGFERKHVLNKRVEI